MINEIAQKATAGTAAGVAIAPTDVFGEYLLSHGIGLLSYSEWLRVIGGAYVLVLLIKALGAGHIVKLLFDILNTKKPKR